MQVVAQVARRGERLGGCAAVVQHVGPAAAGVLREGAVGVECRDRRCVRSAPVGEHRRCVSTAQVVAQDVAADAAHAVFNHPSRAVVDRRGGVVHDFNGDRRRGRIHRAVRGGQGKHIGFRAWAVRDRRCQLIGVGRLARGAVVARRLNVPLLGINLGRVGFMAEVEKSTFEEIAKAIIDKSYVIEPRLFLEYEIERNGSTSSNGWALNEVTIECEQGTMIELLLQIDGRPISSWWADGLIVATPTGSTAYAFSVGGPIVWPQTDALVVTPIAAHALFTRPLVIPPSSDIAIDILSEDGIVKADALRFDGLLVGDRVKVKRASEPIKLAHVHGSNFSDRLVAKFKLPIEGWRGA